MEEVKEEEDAWEVRACEGILHINAHLIELAEATRQHNELLAHLVGMLEEEIMMVAWRQHWEGVCEEQPIIILSEGDDNGNDKGEFEDGGEEEE